MQIPHKCIKSKTHEHKLRLTQRNDATTFQTRALSRFLRAYRFPIAPCTASTCFKGALPLVRQGVRKFLMVAENARSQRWRQKRQRYRVSEKSSASTNPNNSSTAIWRLSRSSDSSRTLFANSEAASISARARRRFASCMFWSLACQSKRSLKYLCMRSSSADSITFLISSSSVIFLFFVTLSTRPCTFAIGCLCLLSLGGKWSAPSS